MSNALVASLFATLNLPAQSTEISAKGCLWAPKAAPKKNQLAPAIPSTQKSLKPSRALLKWLLKNNSLLITSGQKASLTTKSASRSPWREPEQEPKIMPKISGINAIKIWSLKGAKLVQTTKMLILAKFLVPPKLLRLYKLTLLLKIFSTYSPMPTTRQVRSRSIIFTSWKTPEMQKLLAYLDSCRTKKMYKGHYRLKTKNWLRSSLAHKEGMKPWRDV